MKEKQIKKISVGEIEFNEELFWNYGSFAKYIIISEKYNLLLINKKIINNYFYIILCWKQNFKTQ